MLEPLPVTLGTFHSHLQCIPIVLSLIQIMMCRTLRQFATHFASETPRTQQPSNRLLRLYSWTPEARGT